MYLKFNKNKLVAVFFKNKTNKKYILESEFPFQVISKN